MAGVSAICIIFRFLFCVIQAFYNGAFMLRSSAKLFCIFISFPEGGCRRGQISYMYWLFIDFYSWGNAAIYILGVNRAWHARINDGSGQFNKSKEERNEKGIVASSWDQFTAVYGADELRIC
jgi:hypothetical protein